MCSRFWGTPCGAGSPTATQESLEFPENPNVAPSERVPVVHLAFGKQTTSLMYWGFTLSDKPDLINARIEGVFESTLFARFAMEKRCLIPAMGFYEWAGEKGSKQPWCFRLREDKPLAFAGIWREYVGSKQFVILTTAANDLLNDIHHRMPCILEEGQYEEWLHGDPAKAIAMASRPFPSDRMDSYRVTKAMGNPKYKNRDACEPMRSLFDFE